MMTLTCAYCKQTFQSVRRKKKYCSFACYNQTRQVITADGTMKRCPKCKEWKPLDGFNVVQTSKHGVSSGCKACVNEEHRRYRVLNADKEAAAAKRYRENNRALLAARWRAAYQKDRTKFLERAKRYNEANREKIQERRRNYRERERERGRQAYQKNRLKHLAWNLRYRRQDPAANRARVARRRARLHGNGGSYTAAEWRALCAKYDHRCLACGQQEPAIQLTVDHVVPIVHGGSNNIDNIQPLCFKCNQAKRTKTIDYRPK